MSTHDVGKDSKKTFCRELKITEIGAHGLILFRVIIFGKQKPLALVSVGSTFSLIVFQQIDTLALSPRSVINSSAEIKQGFRTIMGCEEES